MLTKKRNLGTSATAALKSILALACSLQMAAPAIAATTNIPLVQRTFYVSKTGSNGDGRSWQTAFKELNQIKWYEMIGSTPVTIYIDGGPAGSSMTYNTSLDVPFYMGGPPPKGAMPVAGPSSLTISVDPYAAVDTSGHVFSHAGTVIIDGQHRLDHLISIQYPNVTINGLKFRGMVLQNFTNYGLEVINQVATVKGLDFEGLAGAGIWQPSYPAAAIYASSPVNTSNLLTLEGIITHNVNNGVYLANGTRTQMSLCWMHGEMNTPGQNMHTGVRFSPFQSTMGFMPPMPTSSISQCVFGPGLGIGVTSPKGTGISLSNSLLLNAAHTNLEQTLLPIIDPPGPGGTQPMPMTAGQPLVVNNVTSFLTRLNPNGAVHDFIYSPLVPREVAVNNSVVFGGQVILPPGRVGSGNIQDRTTGNTHALSDRETDPHFLEPQIYNYGSGVSNQTLINTNWAVRRTLNTGLAGSNITSVGQLLRMSLP
jgi:hypothetical protein